MPPPLPDRYRLEQRLGRDDDLEEWLAHDTSLDRPVLIRALGPESAQDRREQFLDAMRNVAGVQHMHLAAVYSAAPAEGGAYSVTEWTGGVTMRDRLDGGDPMTPEEFITNAAGLAGALAALHDASVIHGSIDPSAIGFSKAHPAKLGAFGRVPTAMTDSADVRAMAETLHACLTGDLATSTPPSQLLDGISPTVDDALTDARSGVLDARGLEAALQGAPNAPTPVRREGWTWRWLAPATLLLLVAGGLIALGLLLANGSNSPALFPARPPTSTVPATIVPETTTTTGSAPPSTFSLLNVTVYDPYGDAAEHDATLSLLTDGDPTTAWRTERYFDPLPLIKDGVGVVFEVAGTPTVINVRAISDGTMYSVLWAQQLPRDFAGWARIAGGTVAGGSISLQVPKRSGGFWLLWLTDLPQQEDGYFASIGEVSFEH
jgi:serine/threonine protein kinase